MAGDADGTPADSPEARETTDFTGVGTVNSCSCTAISTSSSGTWVLTAAHVVGSSSTVTVKFYVEGVVFTYTTSSIYVNENYNSTTHDYDVALIYIPEGISSLITSYSLYSGTTGSLVGQNLTLVGFGGSGYGNLGYDSSTYPLDGVTNRVGQNRIDSLATTVIDSSCVFLSMDFDNPSTTGVLGSLGNDVETTFCTGDSGGAAFVKSGDEYFLAGVNCLVDYSGSTMGSYDTFAYSVSLPSVMDWINGTVAAVPESASTAFAVGFVVILSVLIRRRRKL